MHPNEALIDGFYRAFAQRDHATMAAAYHAEARFSDPVFPDLDHDGVTSMWRMLCERAIDLELSHRDVRADAERGSAHWEAHYVFTATKRRVHNRIDATLTFRDGKIIRHDDAFDFWAWSRMALGPAGVVLGWSSLLQNKVRRQASENLARFRSR
jgi:hypothetical protein